MRVVVSALAMLGVFGFLTSSVADIPKVINYQGRIADSGGAAVPDGDYQMRFRIVDAPSGGTVLWDSGFQTVAVYGGVFNVLLGESPLPTIELDFAEDYWLLVTFEGVNQTPRQRLTSAGYAYMASGLVAGTEVMGAVDTGTNSALKVTNTAPSGFTYGVYGVSSSTQGRGVCGHATATSGLVYGVFGRCDSTLGHGVYGNASATSGDTNGVYGVSFSSSGKGVYGIGAATIGETYGVFGESVSTEGTGVYGLATATTGTTYGGYFESASQLGVGVYANASSGTGPSVGVIGSSYGSFGGGVYGYALATTGTNYGTYGHSASGYGVYYSGGLAGTGTKSCIVRTSQGPRLLYCQESPECWFEDFGEGQLTDGRCHIALDPLFLETVTVDAVNPMQVFLQPYHKSCVGLVVERGETGFDVYNPLDPSASGNFGYRVVAKRKGLESKRLDYCKAGETDPCLYPELREKLFREPPGSAPADGERTNKDGKENGPASGPLVRRPGIEPGTL